MQNNKMSYSFNMETDIFLNIKEEINSNRMVFSFIFATICQLKCEVVFFFLLTDCTWHGAMLYIYFHFDDMINIPWMNKKKLHLVYTYYFSK